MAFVSMPAYKRHAQIKEMIESVAKELMCKIDVTPSGPSHRLFNVLICLHGH